MRLGESSKGWNTWSVPEHHWGLPLSKTGVLFITPCSKGYWELMWYSKKQNFRKKPTGKFSFFFFFFKILLVYLRERENEQGGRAEEEREKQTPCPMQGWIPGPWDHDPSRRQTLHWLSHPGAPRLSSWKAHIVGEFMVELLKTLRRTGLETKIIKWICDAHLSKVQ